MTPGLIRRLSARWRAIRWGSRWVSYGGWFVGGALFVFALPIR